MIEFTDKLNGWSTLDMLAFELLKTMIQSRAGNSFGEEWYVDKAYVTAKAFLREAHKEHNKEYLRNEDGN